MAGNKRPRKPYRNHPATKPPNTLAWLIEGLRPTVDFRGGSEYRKLLLKGHTAHAAIVSGDACLADARTLRGMLEVAEVLAHRFGIGASHLDLLAHARTSMESLCQMAGRTGRRVYSGIELGAMRDLLALHESQLDGALIQHLDQTLIYLRQLNGQTPQWVPSARETQSATHGSG